MDTIGYISVGSFNQWFKMEFKEKKDNSKIKIAALIMVSLLSGTVIGILMGTTYFNAEPPLTADDIKHSYDEYLERPIVIIGGRTYVQIKVWELPCLKDSEKPAQL